eukprot:TRINITY_DN1875_c7_g1_i1.p4 TRINITY_DN1875_c7_g1~~TRINITY_DN1875_c7_g1_i1.p4  ORF type:complete len:116 (-),score=19.20 TRINITY_DN1875_c7_g1_i1:116-463(-)
MERMEREKMKGRRWEVAQSKQGTTNEARMERTFDKKKEHKRWRCSIEQGYERYGREKEGGEEGGKRGGRERRGERGEDDRAHGEESSALTREVQKTATDPPPSIITTITTITTTQ